MAFPVRSPGSRRTQASLAKTMTAARSGRRCAMSVQSAGVDDVHALGGRVAERALGEPRVLLPVAECDLGALAKHVDHLHPRQAVVVDAQPRPLESGVVLFLRGQLKPAQAALPAGTSEERRVGKEWVRTGRSRGWP